MTTQEGIIEATSCCSKIVTHQGVFFDVSVSVLDLQDNPSQVYTFIEHNATIIDQFDRLSASVTSPYLHSHHSFSSPVFLHSLVVSSYRSWHWVALSFSPGTSTEWHHDCDSLEEDGATAFWHQQPRSVQRGQREWKGVHVHDCVFMSMEH